MLSGSGRARASGWRYSQLQLVKQTCLLATCTHFLQPIGVGIRGIDTVGDAELPSKLQLTVDQVHRENGISTSNSSGSNRRQADASSAEYSYRLATADLRGMQYRPGSCQHGAPNEAGDIRRVRR